MLGDSLRRRHETPDGAPETPKRTSRGRSSGRGGRFGIRHWLIAAVVILLGSFVVGYLLSTQILFPKPETAGTGIPVPELYGADRTVAEQRLAEAGLEVGEVTALVSPESEPGRVLAQDPLPGQQLRPGGAVSFAVSTGAVEVRVPVIHGLDALAAQALLRSAGLTVEVQQARTVEVRKGAVVGTEPAGGTLVQLPGVVTLVVSAGPPMVDSLTLPLDDSLQPAAVPPGG